MNIFEMPEMNVLALYAEEVMNDPGVDMGGGPSGDYSEDV